MAETIGFRNMNCKSKCLIFRYFITLNLSLSIYLTNFRSTIKSLFATGIELSLQQSLDDKLNVLRVSMLQNAKICAPIIVGNDNSLHCLMFFDSFNGINAAFIRSAAWN